MNTPVDNVTAIRNPVLTQAQIVAKQKALSRIKQAAQEIIGYAAALMADPLLITMDLCDDIHACVGRIEACGQILAGSVETGELERETERADMKDFEAGRSV